MGACGFDADVMLTFDHAADDTHNITVKVLVLTMILIPSASLL